MFFLSCVCYAFVCVCLYVPCGRLYFPIVSWVLCGTWLHRFLIFAPLLTFILMQTILEGYNVGNHIHTASLIWWLQLRNDPICIQVPNWERVIAGILTFHSAKPWYMHWTAGSSYCNGLRPSGSYQDVPMSTCTVILVGIKTPLGQKHGTKVRPSQVPGGGARLQMTGE